MPKNFLKVIRSSRVSFMSFFLLFLLLWLSFHRDAFDKGWFVLWDSGGRTRGLGSQVDGWALFGGKRGGGALFSEFVV